MKTIILDTNFLLIPFTLNVDIFEEVKHAADFPYKLVIIDKTKDELKKLQKDKSLSGRQRQAAKMALTSIKAYSIKVIKTSESADVDTLILKYTKSHHDTVVATQDLELKRKLRTLRTPLIVLRQKKRLVLQKY